MRVVVAAVLLLDRCRDLVTDHREGREKSHGGQRESGERAADAGDGLEPGREMFDCRAGDQQARNRYQDGVVPRERS